jgi:hypothetical protein
MHVRKTAVGLAALALVGGVGCGRGDDERVAALERRIAQLEGGAPDGAGGPKGPVGPGPIKEDEKATTYRSDWADVPVDAVSKRGIDWLVSVQGDDGGWGQDGGHKGDARDGVSMESQGNDVANTALVGLALVRAGAKPTDATPEGRALRRAVEFVLSHVERAPDAGLAITDRTGTQIQRKLGANVDTFLASMLLTQVDGRVGDGALPARVREGMKKCVAKIERHQQADGSWNDGAGWAPVIATSLASNGLAQAKARGVPVSDTALERVSEYTKGKVAAAKAPSGTVDFDAMPGGAGVGLYQLGQTVEELSRDEKSRRENASTLEAAATRLADAKTLAGFGSMGGEEFVSYMNLSDSLRRTGGKPFADWNTKIVEHLGRLQNKDGTWAGHHCITGRVACTASAVMTILAERTGPRGS